MLSRMLNEVVERIEAFEIAGERAAFAGELRAARPDLFGQLSERFGEDDTGRIARMIASSQLGLIKDIPVIVGCVRQAIDQSSTHPAVRCAMVGALAYLAKPRDLIPDDRPGGFGFVDDCMILRATTSEYFDVLPPGFTNHQRERDNLRLLAISVPPGQRKKFQEAINGVWQMFHSLLLVPPAEVEHTIQQITRNPTDVSFPLPSAVIIFLDNSSILPTIALAGLKAVSSFRELVDIGLILKLAASPTVVP